MRRAEGNGFYTWETEKKRVAAGSWTVTSGQAAVPFETPLPNGGYFELEATARQESGRYAVTNTSFYVLGSGYTAWERFDHNRIEVVADKRRYKPGDTARIMIQSPWERATALKPDLVVLDLGLPDARVTEWIGQIRDTNAQVRFIGLTSDELQAYRVRAMGSGVDYFVPLGPMGHTELTVIVHALQSGRARH